MTVALTELEPQIRIRCPGILEPVMDDAVTRMVRKFFWESEVWKYTSLVGKDWTLNTLALPALTPGTDIPTGTLVKRIDTITYSLDGAGTWDEVLNFKTQDELDRSIPDWRTATGTSPSYWSISPEGEVLVTPQATATQSAAMLLRAVIAPGATTTVIPANIFYSNESTIRAGVLMDLLGIKGKDWTDVAEANKMAAAFEAGIKIAKSRAEAGFGQPKGTVSYGGL